jgi:hypothetical protein
MRPKEKLILSPPFPHISFQRVHGGDPDCEEPHKCYFKVPVNVNSGADLPPAEISAPGSHILGCVSDCPSSPPLCRPLYGKSVSTNSK